MREAGAALVRPGLLTLCVALAVASALLPEIAYRWFYYLRGFMSAATIIGPVVFVPSSICAYYSSGKKKPLLLLWVLAPICFGRLLLDLWVGLLWTLRGGMV